VATDDLFLFSKMFTSSSQQLGFLSHFSFVPIDLFNNNNNSTKKSANKICNWSNNLVYLQWLMHSECLLGNPNPKLTNIDFWYMANALTRIQEQTYSYQDKNNRNSPVTE